MSPRSLVSLAVNTVGKIDDDDYVAKIRFWARHPKIVPPPPGPKVPYFPPQKFNSHAEMNVWKEELLRKMAAQSRG